MEYDFSGYATRNNIVCSDGRTIKRNAFVEQDGMKVPLVWHHQRNDPENVIGHAYLENRNDGVYCYCKLNDSAKAKATKLIVQHGDVDSLSIYANKLVQKGGDVMHGVIREVSVVIAGANSGARIDNPIIQHGEEDAYEDISQAVIYGSDAPDDICCHSDGTVPTEPEAKPETNPSDGNEKPESKPLDEGKTDEPEKGESEIDHADDKEDETVEDVYNSMTDKQKKVVAYIVAAALESNNEETEEDQNEEAEQSDMGDEGMNRRIFDQNGSAGVEKNSLTHDEFSAIIADAEKNGSLKASFLAHAKDYGIENIDVLFPDARLVNRDPNLIKRDTEWVAGVLSETTHVPFSRIKSTAADLTADEARAKGYVRGNKKKDEVIKLLKRITTPTTVYKKQKLDRDDMVEITELDVVAFLKAEMRLMLNEELAGAYLVGDGRDIDDEDKINEDNIRPIWKDDDMYAHHVLLNGDIENDPELLVEQIIRARKYYKGSGSPSLYTTSDTLVNMLLAKDKLGRRLYNSEADLAAALRVSKIVEVPVMEEKTREVDGGNRTLRAIMTNLRDYTVGATRGGEVSMFDDFDIDFNQYKYLIETRCSGALTVPKSALVFESVPASGAAAASDFDLG